MALLVTRNDTEADKEWTGSALRNRHDIKIYGHNGMNNMVYTKSIKGSSTNVQMVEHDQVYKNYLMKACNDVGTDYPDEKDGSYKRDYYLIRDATSMYFTGYFDPKGKARLQIKGREAWIVEMFANKIQESRASETHRTSKSSSPFFPIYMFSEDMKTWCQLNYKTLKWIHILRPPKPMGVYLAIGSDPISSTARVEISLI